MAEVGMNQYEIDRDVIEAHIREARRMRSEALDELLVKLPMKLARLPAAIGRLARSLARGRKWNLSVPAPHR
jgi:hypothetical protein